jgi:hypothetical protein
MNHAADRSLANVAVTVVNASSATDQVRGEILASQHPLRHDRALDLVVVVVSGGVIEALVRRTYSA